VSQAPFSRRFWAALLEFDRRLVNAMAGYDGTMRRFRVSRSALSSASQQELHLEWCEAVAEVRATLKELRTLERRRIRAPSRLESL
jgi:hypothetical protein